MSDPEGNAIYEVGSPSLTCRWSSPSSTIFQGFNPIQDRQLGDQDKSTRSDHSDYPLESFWEEHYYDGWQDKRY